VQHGEHALTLSRRWLRRGRMTAVAGLGRACR
jgi:hypothetical protein